MPDGKKIIRFIAYGLELCMLYVLQESPNLFPLIFGARPILMIPAAITIAMVENETAAMGFGIAAGLLMDFSTGGSLGFYAAVLAVVCFVVSRMANTVLRVNMVSAFISGLWAAAMTIFLGWAFHHVLGGYSSSGYVFLHYYLPVCFYTILLIPLIFYINRGISRSLRRQY